MKNQIVTTKKTCEACAHFRPSLKEDGDRGLCAVFHQITMKDGSCRSGFTPKLPTLQTRNVAFED